MVQEFSGKYKLVKNENFVEYLEANGVPVLVRKAAGSAPFTLEIQQNGDDYKLILGSLVFKKSDSFTLGQTSKESEHFGHAHTSLTTIEDGKIHTVMTPVNPDKGVPQTIRDIENNGDEVIISIKFGDISCRRIFSKA